MRKGAPLSELMLGRGRGYSLVPFDPKAEEFIRGLKAGDGVWVKVRKVRNAKFHRKFFALLNLAFDAWEPGEEGRTYRGQAVAKNFERFREDVMILAGHYDVTYKINGDIRLVAKSISFGKMDELEFNDVYRDVFNVLWDRVLEKARFASREEVERIVNQLLAFE